MYANHTRLEQVKRNGDLKIEGEITQYQQRNKKRIKRRLFCTNRIVYNRKRTFVNNTNHNEDFEKQFTATASYDTI